MQLLFLGLVLSTIAFAHPLDMGLMRMEARERILTLSFGFHPTVAARVLGVEIEKLNPEQGPTLFRKTLAQGKLAVDGARCQWRESSIKFTLHDAQNVSLDTEAECPVPPTKLTVSFPFLKEWESTFRVLTILKVGSEDRVATLEPAQTEAVLDAAGGGGGFGHYVLMGIEHIGATPSQWKGPEGFHLPEGLDHIVFVIALILAGGTLWQLFQIVTGFTLGHSITLALGALGLFQLPSRLVESLIALSIAAVAAEVWFPKFHKHRWKLAAFFGLVHGMGFASALSDLKFDDGGIVKALLGFNIGVEVGQAIIVVVTLPLLTLLGKKSPALHAKFIKGLSLAIGLAGTFWFFQRVTGWGEG